MCGCNTPTPIARNSARAIAIIHPAPGSNAAAAGPRQQQLRLFFSNPAPHSSSPWESTTVSFDSSDLGDHRQSHHSSLTLRIHNHGDLTATSSSSSSSISSLASEASGLSDAALHVLEFRSTDSAMATAELTPRLELGVGGEGVIGKMVSVSCDGDELGDGIIGWN